MPCQDQSAGALLREDDRERVAAEEGGAGHDFAAFRLDL